MPWRREAMKDVASCDKPRGAANRLRSGDFRMGQPLQRQVWRSPAEFIGREKQTRGSEPSQYPEEKKAIRDSVSSGERKRNSPNLEGFGSRGVVGRSTAQARKLTRTRLVEGHWKVPPKRVTAP
jgi:hypothetical protein